MRTHLLVLLTGLFVSSPVAALSQERPRPLEATYFTKSDIEAVLKSPDEGVDRQIGVVDIGKSNVAVGVLHRGPTTDEGDAVSGIIHHQVTEVYYVISGSGTLTTGGTLEDPVARAPDSASVTVLVGPSDAGTSRNGSSRRVTAGDVVVIPAGVFHGWSRIEDHVTYLSIRPDPDRVLPAGYVHPAIGR